MRTRRKERLFIAWRREKIRRTGSARGSPGINELRHYTEAQDLTYGEECLLLRRRLGYSTATVPSIVGISHVTVIRIEKDEVEDRHGYRDMLRRRWEMVASEHPSRSKVRIRKALENFGKKDEEEED